MNKMIIEKNKRNVKVPPTLFDYEEISLEVFFSMETNDFERESCS